MVLLLLFHTGVQSYKKHPTALVTFILVEASDATDQVSKPDQNSLSFPQATGDPVCTLSTTVEPGKVLWQ